MLSLQTSLLSLTMLAACCLQFLSAAPLQDRARTRHRRDTVRNHRSSHRGDWSVDLSSWPCPSLTCPPIGSCKLVEVVAWVHGPRLCEGCPYCLDGPQRTRRDTSEGQRTRRDLVDIISEVIRDEDNEACPEIACPVEPPSSHCEQPGILDGYMRGHKCASCAACMMDTQTEVTSQRESEN